IGFPVFTPRSREAIGCEEVQHNVVIVARVERDVAPARLSHSPYHVDGLVTIERGYFNRDHIFNLCKTAPERKRQWPASDRRLKIKADERNDLSHSAAMGQQLIFVCRFQPAET